MYKLEKLQHRAGKIVTQSNHVNLVEDLGWTSLLNRRKYHLCVSIFKYLHGFEPQILCDNVVLLHHNYNTQRNRIDINLPKMRTEIGKKTFNYSASKLFNTLPAEIKTLETISKFKSQLRIFFT